MLSTPSNVKWIDLPEPALPPRVFDQKSRTDDRRALASTAPCLPGRNCVGAGRISARNWRRRRSCPFARGLEGDTLPCGFHARIEKGILGVGPRANQRTWICLARRIRGVYRKRHSASAGSRLYRQSRGAPSKKELSRGIDRNAQQGRNRIRSKIFGLNGKGGERLRTLRARRTDERRHAIHPEGMPAISQGLSAATPPDLLKVGSIFQELRARVQIPCLAHLEGVH